MKKNIFLSKKYLLITIFALAVVLLGALFILFRLGSPVAMAATLTCNSGESGCVQHGSCGCGAGFWICTDLDPNTYNCACSQPSMCLSFYTVTASAGVHGSISPSTRVVDSGDDATFTITPNADYSVVTPIGGTCPLGTLSGTSYTTGAITSNCTVAVVFTAMSGSINANPNPCIISQGASSCNTVLQWSTENAQSVSRVTSSYPAANTTIANGNSGSQSISIPYISSPRPFYLYSNNILLDQVSVTANCASDTTWDGTTCSATTGQISATSCTIASGDSTCQSSVTWSTNSLVPGANTAVTATNAPRTVSTATSGTNMSVVVNYNSTVFYLYHNNVNLSEAAVTATCTSGTTWDGTTCSPRTPATGDISATSCTIDSGASTCKASVNWSTNNPVPGADTAVTATNVPRTVSTASSSIKTNVTVRFGKTTFYLYHNSLELDEDSIDVSCDSGTAWDGSICTVAPIDGGWYIGPWGDCEKGEQMREVSCTNPAPANGGADCPQPEPASTQACSGPAGVCALKHYSCAAGYSDPVDQHSLISKWTWACVSDGGSAACTEQKRKPIFIEN